ncbi:hypothetical protein OG820_34465 [Streptomyces sp. NBC_00211]
MPPLRRPRSRRCAVSGGRRARRRSCGTSGSDPARRRGRSPDRGPGRHRRSGEGRPRRRRHSRAAVGPVRSPGPVTEAARATPDPLPRACPDEVVIEFGVDLAVEAGAVITRSGAACHLKVIVARKASGGGRAGPDESVG